MPLNINGTTGISGVDGSVSAPAVTGTDSNTGITFPSADTIKFSTGGVERMAITNSGVSGITPGITMVDQWRLTSSLTLNNLSGNHITISTNLERVDSVGQTTLNGGMTHSSGIWTFPETGIYKVEFVMTALTNSDTNYVDTQMKYDFDGDGTYVDVARILQCSLGGNSYTTGYMSSILDVDNTANCKLLVRGRTSDSTTTLQGNSGINYTYFTFTRLGDT
jgi:hypothetical protein